MIGSCKRLSIGLANGPFDKAGCQGCQLGIPCIIGYKGGDNLTTACQRQACRLDLTTG